MLGLMTDYGCAIRHRNRRTTGICYGSFFRRANGMVGIYWLGYGLDIINSWSYGYRAYFKVVVKAFLKE